MDKMHGITGDGAPMLRFDDGMVSMAELIRTMAELPVNEIMDARADEACESGNRRNACRYRKLATGVGAINLGIPNLRADIRFPEDLIERCSRADCAVIAAVSEMLANGASTRKEKRVARTVDIGRISASQVSRACSLLDESVSDLRERDPSDVIYPTSGSMRPASSGRDAGRVRPTALVAAIDAVSGGCRRLPGFDAIDTESYDGRKSFPLSLRARGVDGVTCVTTDAHGDSSARSWRSSRAPHRASDAQRRCRRADQVEKGHRAGNMGAVFAERDPELVRELRRLAAAQIEGFCP